MTEPTRDAEPSCPASRNGYGAGFSAFYERHWRGFGEAAAPRVLAWLQDRGIERGTVLDLCCGTGASSQAFVEAGWRVVGVDLSPNMIALARARHDGDHRTLHLVGDVTALPLADDFAAGVTLCLYDSLNHLPDEAALGRALEQAARHTRAGGLLVADLNTRRGLAGWQDALQVIDDGDDGVLVARGSADAGGVTASLALTGFVPDGRGAFTRFDECDTERWFPAPVLAGLLETAGWRDVRFTSYRDLDEQLADPEAVERLVVVARRAAG